MSYLAKLKAALATEPSVGSVGSQGSPVPAIEPLASVGFAGASSAPFSEVECHATPSVGSVGNEGRGFQPIKSASIAETPLPQHPPKLTEGQPADAVRRAELRNSPALFEPQLDLTRCYICGGQEEQGRLFIAVLTAKPGAHHWLHADCHPEHVRRLDARAEAALADDEPAPF